MTNKNERKVLVISYYFPPMGLSGVQRTTKFVKYLPEYGWEPIVLTTSAPAFYAFDNTLNEEIESKKIKVYRTPEKKSKKTKDKKTVKFPSYFLQKLGRAFLQTIYQPDRMIRWKKKALKLADEIFKEHEISAIFATAPPFTDFLIARKLAAKYKVPFVVDYRDVWVDNPFHFFATPFHKRYAARLENDILNHAGKVIVTSRYTKELILKRYKLVQYNDIVIITHGYDYEDFAPFLAIKPNPKKFTITHSGLFQDNRTPKYFLKALAKFLKNNPAAKEKVEARFVGIMRQSHQKYIYKLGLETNVVQTGYVEHPEVIKNIMESDVLWLMQFDIVRSPGKLYEYFGARKPLLVSLPDGIIRKTALESKAAIATDPKDVDAIAGAIATFYSLWENNNLPMPQEFFVSNYDRKLLTGILSREIALTLEI